MKRFLLRSIVFAVPFAALALIELLVLPIDFSTFRVWEALRTDSMRAVLPGYFYPHMQVTKMEEGDLGHHSANAVKRRVEWQTDGRGYRNSDEAETARVVIIGDSNTVGSGLTQGDTIPAALGRALGTPVYGLAPGSVNALLKNRWFLDTPPRIVIVASVEWDLMGLRRIKGELARPSAFQRLLIRADAAIKENPLIQALAVPLDRLFKMNLLLYTRAAIRRAFVSHGRAQAQGAPQMLFLLGEKANEDVSQADFDHCVETIVSYRNFFKDRGIRFIFLPIPNKENIYYNLLPARKKPVFVAQLIAALKAAGVETIDTQTAFDETYRERGPVLYQTDDSHWGPEGVKVAARLLAKAISGSGK